MSEKEFFDLTFEEDWKKRQAREKRKDRRTDKSYYEFLMDKKEKAKRVKEELRTSGATTYAIKQATKGVKPTSHELVVGIGNIKDNLEFGRDGFRMEVSKEILRRYIESFNERNRGCVVLYNASIHTDEKGVVHCHCDFCFVSKNKHGEKEISQTAALRELGFISDKEKNEHGKRQNAITKWRDNEREVLKSICREYGIEIINGTKGKKHLEKEEYILEQNKEKLEHEKEQFDELLFQSETGNTFLVMRENDSLRSELSSLQKQNDDENARLSQLWKEYKDSSSTYWKQYTEHKELLKKEIALSLHQKKIDQERMKSLFDSVLSDNNFILTRLFRLISALFLKFKMDREEQYLKQLQELQKFIKSNARKMYSTSKLVEQSLKSEDMENIYQNFEKWERTLKTIDFCIENQLSVHQHELHTQER